MIRVHPGLHRDSLSPISFTEPYNLSLRTFDTRRYVHDSATMANRQNYDVVVDVDNEVRLLPCQHNCDTPQCTHTEA